MGFLGNPFLVQKLVIDYCYTPLLRERIVKVKVIAQQLFFHACVPTHETGDQHMSSYILCTCTYTVYVQEQDVVCLSLEMYTSN